MSARVNTKSYDVAIIGAGVAGTAAALFAASRGLSTTLVGNAGGILFASGALDLMAVHPLGSGTVHDDPWAAIAALTKDEPGHPYARIPRADIEAAFESYLAALAAEGLPYVAPSARNLSVLTSLGTLKTTWALPRSMCAGTDVLEGRKRALIVGIQGLRDVSANQIVAALDGRWPGLRAATVAFPGTEELAEVYAVHAAKALEITEVRAAFAERLAPLVGDAEALGLPAVLGIRNSVRVQEDLEKRLGVPLFEILTMPTSVPGLRMKEALEASLSKAGVRRFAHGGVERIEIRDDGFLLSVGDTARDHAIAARGVILATGRFTGRGLVADRERVHEPILELPVTQPASRAEWHCMDPLAPKGHPINRAGLEVDDAMRALDADGQPRHPHLYAAGSILAHQDWARMKCGAGVALATAWAAVKSLAAEFAPTDADSSERK